jgi:hypothetical protein
MCRVFLFQRSLEAKGGPILRLIFGDGGADFGWTGSRNKASPDGVVLSGVKQSENHFVASLLNLKQVLVRKQLIVAMPKRQSARRRVFCKSF